MHKDDPLVHIPLIDSIDSQIVMHCFAHFSGSFIAMIEYYENQGIGVQEDFTIKRIKEISEVSEEAKELLTEEALDKIENAKKLYQQFKELFEDPNSSGIQKKVADLVLTEQEYPEEEIQALVEANALKPLIEIIQTSTFYDPLNPGYGRAPIHAAKALSLLQDESAIEPLFYAIDEEHFLTDEAMIQALITFGEKSKQMVLKKLSSMPINKDNERAAIVITAFPTDAEIASTCFTILQNPETFKHPSFAPYLVFPCEGLTQEDDRRQFIELSKQSFIPPFIKNEMDILIKLWKN